MKKQATVGALLESFRTFYPEAAAKTAAEASQGRTESGVTEPAKDKEADELTPGSPEPTKNLQASTGVPTGESLPDQPKNIPTQELERKEVSPSSKVAAPSTSGSDLVARLRDGLKKVAEENAKPDKEAEALKPGTPEPGKNVANSIGTDASEAPKEPACENKAAAASGDVDVDLLARKTAAFLHAQARGHEIARTLFSKMAELKGQASQTKTAATSAISTVVPSQAELEALVEQRVTQLKTAGLNDDQIKQQLALDGEADRIELQKRASITEDARVKIAAHVEQRIHAHKEAGVISPQQEEALLTDLGYDTQTAKMARLEHAVEQKVAALRAADPNITEDQIKAELKKVAEDEAAMAAAGGPPPGADPSAGGAPAPGGAPGGAPGVAGGAGGDVMQDLPRAIAELQAAVEAKQMTEEQALQLLEQAGLDVQGMLAAAQGGGAAPGGAPGGPGAAVPDPTAGGPSPAEAGAAPDATASASGGPAPAESVEEKAPAGEPEGGGGKKEEPKEDDKKEASLAVDNLIKAASAAYKFKAISKEQADAMVQALLPKAA